MFQGRRSVLNTRDKFNSPLWYSIVTCQFIIPETNTERLSRAKTSSLAQDKVWLSAPKIACESGVPCNDSIAPLN